MDKLALKRFFSNASTADERKSVIAWLLDPANDIVIKSWMKENWDFICNQDPQHYTADADLKKIWLQIRQKIDESTQLTQSPALATTPISIYHKRNWKRATAAAAAVLLFSAGTFYWWKGTQQAKVSSIVKAANTQQPADIAPPDNCNRAVLTLGDGSTVYLDSTGNGIVATQGEVKVSKNANGEIVYSGSAEDNVQNNSLNVPKGSTPVRLVLADGSVVWLNAASSITYPTAFVRKERRVNITGEAYFEVAKNPAMPFYVMNNDVQVKVLGTHFNVNTYEDEKELKVTLLEGAVSVTKGDKTTALTQGQQAWISGSTIAVRTEVDMEAVMAWKNNEFYFNGADVKTIMRQLEKYYNVDIEYRDNIPYQFVAKISRHVKVSDFLRILELTNLIHFKIEANKIIVMK